MDLPQKDLGEESSHSELAIPPDLISINDEVLSDPFNGVRHSAVLGGPELLVELTSIEAKVEPSLAYAPAKALVVVYHFSLEGLFIHLFRGTCLYKGQCHEL